jgi:hypothetical protein
MGAIQNVAQVSQVVSPESLTAYPILQVIFNVPTVKPALYELPLVNGEFCWPEW